MGSQFFGGGGAAIKSIQHVSMSITGTNLTSTATIASVDFDNSIVMINGDSIGAGNSFYSYFASVELTNSTTVTASRQASIGNNVNIECTVIEFESSAISSIQNRSISRVFSFTGTTSFSSVDMNKTFIIPRGVESGQSGNSNASAHRVNHELISSTQVRATAIDRAATISIVSYFTILEFK